MAIIPTCILHPRLTAKTHICVICDIFNAKVNSSLALINVTRIINPAVIRRFFADAYFLASADHRTIFSTLNHVVKVIQRPSDGHRRATVRWPPDALSRWQNFRPMSRRWSAGGPAVTTGAPGGRRRTTINPTIIGRSSAGRRLGIVRPSTGLPWMGFWNGLLIFACLL